MSKLSTAIEAKCCIYKTFNSSEKQDFYNNVYDILKQTYPSIINEKHYKNLSEKGNVYLAKFYRGIRGCHIHESDDIILSDSVARTGLTEVGLHECIHKICGEEYIKYRRGLAEGMCQDMVLECLYRKSSSRFFLDMTRKVQVQYNLGSRTAYSYPLCLVRQMKKLLNDPLIVAKSKLNGNLKFDKKFKEQFGLPLYIFMNVMTTKCIDEKNVKLFLKTQDVLLEKAFNIKYDKCSGEEEYLNFLNELREFETYRARCSYDLGDKKYKDYYVKYYNKKYENIRMIFNENGYDEKKLEKYKYEPQEFYEEDKFTNYNIYNNVMSKIVDTEIMPQDVNNIQHINVEFIKNRIRCCITIDIVNKICAISDKNKKVVFSIENDNMCIDSGKNILIIDRDRNVKLQDKTGKELEIKSFKFNELDEEEVVYYEEMYGIEDKKIKSKLPSTMTGAIIYMCGQKIKDSGMNIKNILNRNKKLIGGKEIKKLNAPQEPKTMEEKYRVDICDGELSVNNQSLNSEQKKYSRNDDKENEK